MYKQMEYLRETKAITRDSTFRIDLPENGMLSALMLRFDADCTLDATLAADPWRLIDHLTKIEIIANGATVIKSYSGFELQFCNFLAQGQVPPHFWRNYAQNTQMEYLLILFGRFLNDPEYGLDLSQFDNVELRITNTGSSTYYNADIRLSIMQSYLRDVPGGFRGYIRSEEWRKWTTVRNTTEYLVLPTEFPISGLYVRTAPAVTSGNINTGFQNLMSDIDLSIGGGQKQVFKGGLDDLMVMNYLEKGFEIFTSGLMCTDADRAKDIGIGRLFGRAGIATTKGAGTSTTVPTIDADNTHNTLYVEYAPHEEPMDFIVKGMAYHNCAYLWHAPNLEPDLLLDPSVVGDVRLNILTRDAASAASGTNFVFMDRLVI